MSRLRLNNLGDLTGTVNPLTLSTATTGTCSWTSAPAFPLISWPDFAVLVAEPNTANEEIMHLHGFIPGGTTGFVIRAAEPNSLGGQVAVAHTAVAWLHGPSAQDFKSPSSRHFANSYWR